LTVAGATLRHLSALIVQVTDSLGLQCTNSVVDSLHGVTSSLFFRKQRQRTAIRLGSTIKAVPNLSRDTERCICPKYYPEVFEARRGSRNAMGGLHLMSVVDWNEKGTLYFRFQPPEGEPNLSAIWSAPLRELVVMALQGHVGSLENMLIKLDSGPEYLGEAIGALAVRPDRPRGTQSKS
jgi:hypothetical protein